MKGLKILFLGLFFGLMLGSVNTVKAQCAQCAATVESNSRNGGTPTKGLNAGILFLLAAPYLAVGVAGFIWYRKYRRKNVDLHISSERFNLN